MTGGPFKIGSVYFARLRGTLYVKIGLTYSYNVGQRLRKIERQSIVRQKLDPIGLVRCPYWVDARYLEISLHVRCRIRWTDIPNSIECFVLSDTEVHHMVNVLNDNLPRLKEYFDLYQQVGLESFLRTYYEFFDGMLDNACYVITQ